METTRVCAHKLIFSNTEQGYTASVATPGLTAENRAAHGGTTFTQGCKDCGAGRRVNQNGSHFEYSAWFYQLEISDASMRKPLTLFGYSMDNALKTYRLHCRETIEQARIAGANHLYTAMAKWPFHAQVALHGIAFRGVARRIPGDALVSVPKYAECHPAQRLVAKAS